MSKTAILVAALLALLGGALTGAFLFGKSVANKEAEVRHLENINEYFGVMQKNYDLALAFQFQMIDDLKKVSQVARVVKEEVKIYVQPEIDSVCGPSVGVVGMFNQARSNTMPGGARLDVAEGLSASGYTVTEFNEINLDAVERYNELMVRHNKLVDLLAGSKLAVGEVDNEHPVQAKTQ